MSVNVRVVSALRLPLSVGLRRLCRRVTGRCRRVNFCLRASPRWETCAPARLGKLWLAGAPPSGHVLPARLMSVQRRPLLSLSHGFSPALGLWTDRSIDVELLRAFALVVAACAYAGYFFLAF